MRARARVALALVGVALACARPPPPPPPGPPPPAAFFWEIEAPGGPRLFLLGSVHIGSGRELFPHPRVEAAWGQSLELVVEVDTSALTPFEALEITERNGGFLPPELALQDVVSAQTWERASAYLRAHRYSLEVASRMRPWLLAQVVAQIEHESVGLDPENGVDAWFLRRAEGARPVVSLETMDEQLQLFARLPESLQEELLRSVLDESAAFLETTRAILRAWEEGDEASLLALLLGSAEDPELRAFHRLVFVERNHRMAERLAWLVADGRPRFVVIGTGHLIGPESVPELLGARGFRVERVPEAFVSTRPPTPPAPEGLVPPEAVGPAPPEPMGSAPPQPVDPAPPESVDPEPPGPAPGPPAPPP